MGGGGEGGTPRERQRDRLSERQRTAKRYAKISRQKRGVGAKEKARQRQEKRALEREKGRAKERDYALYQNCH